MIDAAYGIRLRAKPAPRGRNQIRFHLHEDLLIESFNPTQREGMPPERVAYGIGLNESTPDRP